MQQSNIYQTAPQQYIVETDFFTDPNNLQTLSDDISKRQTPVNANTITIMDPLQQQNLKLSNATLQQQQNLKISNSNLEIPTGRYTTTVTSLQPQQNLKLSNSNLEVVQGRYTTVQPITIESVNQRVVTTETPQNISQPRVSYMPQQGRQSIAITTQANQYVAQSERKTIQVGDKQVPIVAKIVEQVPIIEKVNVIQKVQPVEYQQTVVDIHHECKIIILNLQKENAYLKNLLAQKNIEVPALPQQQQPQQPEPKEEIPIDDDDKDPKKKPHEKAKKVGKQPHQTQPQTQAPPQYVKVPFQDDLERLKKELLDRNNEIDDLKRQNKELNIVLQDIKLQFDVAQSKVLDYERIIQIKDQENQEWKLKYEQFDARIKNIFIQIEQNRNDDLMKIIEVKTEENNETEQRYAHLSGQLSENFRDQLMQIVILNIENDRLHRILREGIEENKILKNRSDKLMSDKGFEIVQGAELNQLQQEQQQ